MGRETKILLALLGLLVGVFLGVVSVKLFVPRPPAGAGPDVHTAADMEPQMLVEPPALEPVPQKADGPQGGNSPLPPPDAYAERSSRFAPVASLAGDMKGDSPRGGDSPRPPPARDPFVMPAAYEVEPPVAAAGAEPAGEDAAGRWAGNQPVAIPPAAGPVPGASYVTRAGDSWWSLAEQAYGDGRLYRPLFAWNRSLDPRVSLVPGTRLEIPPAERLGAAWPALLPAD